MTAVLSSPGSTRPLVRIRRAPALEPPVDDDRRTDDHPVCAGQLALFTSVHGARGAAGPDGARDRAGPDVAGSVKAGSARVGRAGVAHRSTPSAAGRDTATGRTADVRDGSPAGITGLRLTDGGPAAPVASAGHQPGSATAHVAAVRFVAACVEVLNGFRPVGHLRALTTPFEFAAVTTQLTRRAVRVRMPGSGHPAASGRTADGRVDVRRLRVFEQRAGFAEAVAVLRRGDASWAIALRFEQRREQWLCSLLEVV
jgi:Family of unknown function (DUF6459)